MPSGGNGQALLSDVYDAGIETMFGLDVVKQVTDSKHDTALLEALENASIQSPAMVLRSLPRLFASYVQSLKRHKGAIFSQGSNQASSHIADQLQAAAMIFYAMCVTLARRTADDASWQCRVSLLHVVERENLFSVKDEEAKTLLREDGESAVEALAAAWDGSYIRYLYYCTLNPHLLSENFVVRTDCALKILATLVRIDYDQMSASFAVIYPRLLAVSLLMSDLVAKWLI